MEDIIEPPVALLMLPLSFTPEEGFKHLWDSLPWEQREDAPRRECWFNDRDLPYTYGSGDRARTYAPHPTLGSDRGLGVAVINSVREALRPALGMLGMPDCCFVNGYADQHQFLGWHADDSPEMSDHHPITTVSFGAERELWVRPRGFKGEIPEHWRFSLPSGSALVMYPGMQDLWDHRIPKHPQPCGPRVSLTFRKLV